MIPPTAHIAFELSPLAAVPIAIAALLYWRRAATLARGGRPVPGWRQACFGAGLAVVAIAIFSPIGHVADELVAVHMVEHLLIADIGSLLLVLGLTRSLLQPILAVRGLSRLEVLAHPAVAFPLWAIDLFAWHTPGLYQDAYGMAPVHALEHASFLFFGCLMWMPLFGPLPKPAWFSAGWKVGYVIGVRFTGALLGNVLMWSGTVLYPIYAQGERHWGISPLTDQSTAGVLMMVEGIFLTLGVLAWVFFQVAREGTERQDLLDLARERGVALDEERARRAVAAGHGRLLEQRLAAAAEEGAAGEAERPRTPATAPPAEG